MYTKYYRLTRPPFENTPDPDFLFLSKIHREVLASLTYAINEAKGFVFIIGDVGTGKTTLIHSLIKQLDPSVIVLNITNPRATFKDILSSLARRLGIDSKESGVLELFEAIQHRLEMLNDKGSGHAALIIDEAHLLSHDALENIRLISNIENEKRKLIQIILVGQNELNAKLQKESLRPLKQRLVVTRRLLPLDRKEMEEYILHRLRVAGRQSQVFERKALSLIWKNSQGIPRLINKICDNALLIGYAVEKRSINAKIIKEVIQDMESADRLQESRARLPSKLKWAGAAAVSALLFLLYFNFGLPTWHSVSSRNQAPRKDSFRSEIKMSKQPKRDSSRKHIPELITTGDPRPEKGLDSTQKKGRLIDRRNEPSSNNSQFRGEALSSGKETFSTSTAPSTSNGQDNIFESSRFPEYRREDKMALGTQQQQPVNANDIHLTDTQVSRKGGSSQQDQSDTLEKRTRPAAKTVTPVVSQTDRKQTDGDYVAPRKQNITQEASPVGGDDKKTNVETRKETVRPNECLYDLARRVYGTANESIIDIIHMRNPGLRNVNRIYPGQKLILPELKRDDLIIRDKSGLYEIYYASFYRLTDAKICAESLIRENNKAFSVSAQQGDNSVHRVYVGKFATRKEAQSILNKLELKYLTFFIG